MRIQQLHYIIKIVETGSMNEAAKQLFITQPSLSNAVRDLEREMGIDIFIRNPKGITLTKDGVEFLSYARQVVEQTNLLEERYKSHTETRELFSVSSQHYAFVVNAFVSLLKRADMTRYELFLRETRTYEIIEDVKKSTSQDANTQKVTTKGFIIPSTILKKSSLRFPIKNPSWFQTARHSSTY